MRHDASGMSLVEVLVAMFLIGVGLLAVAPMFMASVQSNATTGDFGEVGAAGVEYMEQLRQADYFSLLQGGSLSQDMNGYVDHLESDVCVRWTVVDNMTPPDTKTITVVAFSTRELTGPSGQVTLTTLRAR